MPRKDREHAGRADLGARFLRATALPVLLLTTVPAHSQDLAFDHLSVEEGLSSS